MSYPTTLDSFSTKNTGDTIQAADVNSPQTAIVSLETKLGVDSSAVATSIDYLLKNTASTSPGHKHVVADITNAGSFIPTGGVIPYAGSSAPTNFLICDGSAKNRTTYAALFAIVSTTFGVGDGSTTFNLPDLRSRIPVGVGTGTKVLTFVSRSSNTLTVSGAANSTTNEVQTGQAVFYFTTGSVITGLTNSTTYYIIRTTYNTFTLATSLANAQAGTPISLSSDGSGTQTFTYTLAVRALGDTGGEETHAMSSTELIAHTHANTITSANGSGGANNGYQKNGAGGSGVNEGVYIQNVSAGGNSGMNITQSFLALNYIIRI